MDIDRNIEKALEMISSSPRYLEWQFSLIKPFLGKRILDVGSGNGNISRLIAATKPDFFVMSDKLPHLYWPYLVSHGLLKNHECLELDMNSFSETDESKLVGMKLDTVVATNVLEHIEDGALATKNLSGVIEPGGKIIYIVPAHPFLYSKVDREHGHFRRYTRKDFQTFARQLDLQIEYFSYWNMAGFFHWMIRYKFFSSRTFDSNQFALVDLFSPFLQQLEKWIWCPFGQSTIVVFNKTDISHIDP